MASGSLPNYNGVKQWDEAATANAVVARDSAGGITVAALACVGLTMTGNIKLSTATKSSAYTAAAETVLICSGTTTITLPPAAASSGRLYAIKKTDATVTLSVDGDGAETIDGDATKTTADQYASLLLFSDGTSWHILASTGTWA